MSINPNGVASPSDEMGFFINHYLDEVSKKYNKTSCCICNEETDFHPFLCEHGVHKECMIKWLVNNPFRTACFECKALIRISCYNKLKPKTVSPANLTHEEKDMMSTLKYYECPECKIWIEKTGGCNKLQCLRCSKNFTVETKDEIFDYRNELNIQFPIETDRFGINNQLHATASNVKISRCQQLILKIKDISSRIPFWNILFLIISLSILVKS